MGSPELSTHLLNGEGARPYLDALARLRIAVFAEWPYLYDGSLQYEQDYLEQYLREPRSLIVLVRDGEQAVAASTALPLESAETEMQAPWRNDGAVLDEILYFGESVVLPAYRGLGLGRRFFALREAHGRALGRSRCTFCAVQRPADHPARPSDYVPNDAFWQRLGYRRRADLHCTFPWVDIGDDQESHKTLIFWERPLEPTEPAPG
ncbi:GNAT family N-acetyltransferase [Algiphilus sp. NNCM1]|uniref:GNAT family N-acetyltransferase n=1 Tax=Algiphilus sp. TaxID=1872431 RepID=UPI001CA7493E|nr:GNAT family N-acetyltransferase [Algiphilus sp.]MBY8964936.1 GNAT family N-acetyltransferase [Algiphilus acroporae]MCI5061723.1 GNAT family N-acetyltransferase [Algiphilus sp.]MCI5102818.1 GNAT family N-acetyltransferase [Algiphilus sp.]